MKKITLLIALLFAAGAYAEYYNSAYSLWEARDAQCNAVNLTRSQTVAKASEKIVNDESLEGGNYYLVLQGASDCTGAHRVTKVEQSPAPTPAPVPAPTPVPTPSPTPTPTPSGLWCNPDMPNMPCVDMDNLPATKAGSNTLDLRSTNEQPTSSPNGNGAARVNCGLAKVGIFDPILYPGVNGKPHLHLFFGNKDVNPNSTPETLSASGASTCNGGIMNRSSYWVPAMIDTSTNKAVQPRNALLYYKNATAQPFPKGLRIIAGNLPTDSTPANNLHSWFECNEQYSSRSKTVPACGGLVTQQVTFPNCWDGENLDSPNHRDHMDYSTNGVCPAAHPVKVPTLSQFIYYPAPSGTSNWRLSSDMYAKNGYNAGYSNHADFMMGWDDEMHKVLVDNCINKRLDCHAHLTGDGRMFY